MSKLSPRLKALINAPHAFPHTIKSPPNIRSIYNAIASSATTHSIGVPAWLTLSAAATITLNSPQSLLTLYALASTTPSTTLTPLQTAELIREVGLKCIPFNGIPRTINMLGAFREGLPVDIQDQLSTQATRHIDSENAPAIVARGRAVWDSIYYPFEDKLVDKLALSHPDLPVVIVQAHYGAQLADLPSTHDTPTHTTSTPASSRQTPDTPNAPVRIGRILTSLLAVSTLRAQTGVAPQVLSHIFGLRKAFEDGSAESEEIIKGGKWLASEEGNIWVLGCVDEIVAGIRGDGEDRTGRVGVAVGMGGKAKL